MIQASIPLTSVELKCVAAVSAREAAAMNTAQLRSSFLCSGLAHPGHIVLNYWENDRTVVGMAIPLDHALRLEARDELRCEHFCERREVGVINIGGPGTVSIDGTTHHLAPHDACYIGAGSRDVIFASTDSAAPAQYYLVSYPAHRACPSVFLPAAARPIREVGDRDNGNHRRIQLAIVPDTVDTCQLVMGMTLLSSGSVWNTMPAHTHARRSEVYMYFGLEADSVVFHLMGPATETRHIVVRDREAVLSPGWSIHSGVGTTNYGFIWAMGGENKVFDDMDQVPASQML
jgi:4-deoxy-L-threo-5-hexosulose-uronate ketol-isomerase